MVSVFFILKRQATARANGLTARAAKSAFDLVESDGRAHQLAFASRRH